MGSQFNFRGFVTDPNGGGGRPPPGNFPLARQGSIYSLTFDEFQNTMGSVGKDFGSMNMDELLKNIWSAEEVQSTVLTPGTGNSEVVGGGSIVGGGPSGFLQRQGSLTLPRTLSQKTVDEVWKDMSKEFGVNGNGKDGNVIAYSNMPQREPTLGEVTLEEFLVRAGVVREEARMVANANANPIMSDFSRDQPLGFGFQQPGSNNTGLMNGNSQIGMESPSLPVTVNGGRSSNQTQQQQQQPQPLFPKQPVLPYGAPPVGIPTVAQLSSGAQLSSPRIRGGMVGDMVQNGGLQGMVNGGVTVAAASPAVSSDGLGRSNGDTSSLSPIPYTFSNGLRGRKGGPLEKVVERRQRRMIKNRESAARSRARKQAYTMELEAEVAKLKEENQELLKKQTEIMEMQKNQVMEMMNMQRGGKRRCLRRTQTGPW